MVDNVEKLQLLIDSHNRIVFFGGAGVSTESGIPDYRSRDGLYNRGYDLPAETLLSHSYYAAHTEEFFSFYRNVMLYPEAEPNNAHKKLAEMERKGKLTAVITQNIDGLHQKAGSEKVFELHGSVHRNHCTECGKFYGLDKILGSDGIPRCECGGVIKPDVVLYEEGLDDMTVDGALRAIMESDMLIIGGTSLNVYPAAGFIRYFKGDTIAVINRQHVDVHGKNVLMINDSIGEVMGRIRI